jgi:ADP-heptose:LPS heptosyltransferase/GT2 family glycosyltransferase
MSQSKTEDLSAALAGSILAAVDSPKPGAVIQSGMQLHGTGWVIAEQEVLEITVYLGDIFLCHAAYGYERNDVFEKYPDFAQASHSGFAFSATVPTFPDAPPPLIVDVKTHGGGQVRCHVHLTAAQPTTAIAVAPAPAPSGIRIFVDAAVLDPHGVLRVTGWIISLAPLCAFTLFMGEQQLGAPEVGIERVDVARDYPLYPNALSSGFRLVQDVAELDQSSPTIRVLAVSEDGLRRQVIVPIELPTTDTRRTSMPDDVPDDVFDIYCDEFAISTDGLVSVEGWAVAAEGIASISILLDDAAVGEAEFGLLRPDVGNRFPHVADARTAGFKFTRRLPELIAGDHQAAICARTSAGREQVVLLSVQVSDPRTVLAASNPAAAAATAVRYSIDLPKLVGDAAAEPLRGALTIVGWAVATGGLASVEVRVDGRSFGPAYIGVRREDLALAFPEHEEALFSGFAQTIPHKMIGEGHHIVQLVIRGKKGDVVERAFSLVSEPPADIAAASLRTRLPQTEVDLKLAVLRRQLYHPQFVVAVILADKPSHASIMTTIESLRRQEYVDWHALFVASSEEASTKAAAAVSNARPEWLQGLQFGSPLTLQQSLDKQLDQPNRFLVVLHAGDRLGADCLLEMALQSALQRDADFIYADERRHDPAQGVTQPWLKPDWAPDLLLSSNYIGRPWCASAPLVGKAGLSVQQMATHGSYDTVLRLTEAARQIYHIPRILCDRTGTHEDSKTLERRALAGALQRHGTVGKIVAGRAGGTWRVKRSVDRKQKVSLIMPTCAAGGHIKVAITSIREKTAYRHFEIIVIDNIPDTQPDWKSWVRHHADRVIDLPDAFNWSRFNNLGAAAADGDFLLFINDDVEAIEPEWLDALVEHAQRPEVGVVGAQLLYPDRKVQHAGLFLDGAHGRHAFRYIPNDEPGSFGLALSQRNVIAVTGACFMVRRDHFEALNGFDEAHRIINNDLDFCLRTWRSSKRVVFTPFASLIHHELASRAKLKDEFDESHFMQAWSEVIYDGDPFFHPLLAASADDYIQEPEPVETLYAGNPIIAKERVRRILAIKVDHIGDFIIALPAFARIKRHFPAAKLTVLAAKASMALAHLEPVIDEVIEFNFFHARSSLGKETLDDDALSALETRLAPYSFDLAIDLRAQPDTRHLLQRSGASVMAGFDTGGRFPWLDIMLEWDGDQHLVPKRPHATNSLVQLVETVAVMCDRDWISRGDLSYDQAIAQLRAFPAASGVSSVFFDQPLVCIHPGAGSAMKQWPTRSYADLIDMFVLKQGLNVVLIGSAEEVKVVDDIRARVAKPDRVISFVNAVSLGDLPVLLQACRLFVGNDSGPKHLAAALGIPTLGIHSSNVDAAEWAPLSPHGAAVRRRMACAPCYISNPSDCHRRLACINGIGASYVYRVARALLATVLKHSLTN